MIKHDTMEAYVADRAPALAPAPTYDGWTAPLGAHRGTREAEYHGSNQWGR